MKNTGPSLRVRGTSSYIAAALDLQLAFAVRARDIAQPIPHTPIGECSRRACAGHRNSIASIYPLMRLSLRARRDIGYGIVHSGVSFSSRCVRGTPVVSLRRHTRKEGSHCACRACAGHCSRHRATPRRLKRVLRVRGTLDFLIFFREAHFARAADARDIVSYAEDGTEISDLAARAAGQPKKRGIATSKARHSRQPAIRVRRRHQKYS